jgi:elongation factor P--(R)-beta-lysine ligase
MFRQASIKKNLILRAKTLQAIRNFFAASDYLEIETPIRTPAPAPEANIDAEPSSTWFLQTSPELYMKRLLAADYPRIFQICRCFRRKERGGRHLSEFTMLEWYTAEDDYFGMMEQTEALIRSVTRTVTEKGEIYYQDQRIDLSRSWEKISVQDAFDRFASVSMTDALEQDRFDEVMGLEIEPNLPKERPVIIYDYPAASGALARLKAENPQFAERFELYIGGLELCNAFTELDDAREQRCRFEAEQENRRQAGKSVYPMPEGFLKALEKMPPAAGNALGVDRLVMLLTDSAAIDDVTAFVTEEL